MSASAEAGAALREKAGASRLEASGLVSGSYAYRRALVEVVFGVAE